MKTQCNIEMICPLKIALLLVIAGLVFEDSVDADGTKEITSDFGLYTGDPIGSYCVDLYQWSFYGSDGARINANFEGSVGTPEGTKVLRVEATNRWAGCGLFFLNCDDATITDYDFSDYVAGHLRFFLKSTNQVTVEIEFRTTAGLTNKASTNINSTTNIWQEIVLPLNNFRPAINFHRIRGPFLITVPDSLRRKVFFVDHVRWTKPVDRFEVYPALAQVNQGKHVQFTVEGKSTAGESILLYSNFQTDTSVGTMSPAPPVTSLSAVLTGGTNSGSIVANAIADVQPLSFITGTAAVDIVSQPLETECALLNETSPKCLMLDVDAKLLVLNGEGVAEPLLSFDGADFREGRESLKTTINHQDADAFSGWTIQWGTEFTADSETRDMSNYYDDFIRFWFKSDPQLQGKLFVGIRSGNTPAGFEYSKVWLTNYVACDGQWHSVAIPLRVLAGPRPWADLSRIKNLFTIAAVGATQGPVNFSIDNLRWGALRARFESIRYMPGGSAQLRLASNPGIPHILERSSDLLNWESISTNIPATSVLEFLDTGIQPGGRSFYRVRTE